MSDFDSADFDLDFDAFVGRPVDLPISAVTEITIPVSADDEED